MIPIKAIDTGNTHNAIKVIGILIVNIIINIPITVTTEVTICVIL